LERQPLARDVYSVYNLYKSLRKGLTVDSREIIRLLEEAGWHLKAVKGDHHQFVHSDKPGKVTVPHPVKDLKKGTVNSIFRQAGLK